jgi:uncharacterized protein YjiS (DUF1127 family)
MSDLDQIEQSFSRRHLRPAQWERCQAGIVRGAEEARARALREIFGHRLSALGRTGKAAGELAWALFRRTGKVVARLAAALATWQMNRRAIRDLHALGDRTLKDFGIHRSEIESVVYGEESRLRSEQRVAAFARRYPQRKATGAPRGQPPRKHAA